MVSVIVPIYNAEKYLNDCIKSIVNQSYKDIEILLINDGSRDESALICDKWVLQDHRVRLINKENGGVSSARNLGIKESKGEYICFVDADDYVDELYIETMVKNIEKYNANMSMVSYRKDINYKQKPKKIYIMDSKKTLINMLLSKKIDSSVCCKLIPKELYEDNIFNENMLIAEDLNYFFTILKSGGVCVFEDTNLYYYRQHKGSAITFFNDEKKKSLQVIYKMIEEEKDQEIRNSLISKYLSTCFHFYIISEKKYDDYLKSEIKKFRLTAIFNKNITLKVKLASLLSFVSFKLVKEVFCSISK